jgi:uncharacterized protein (TIGR03000 family)
MRANLTLPAAVVAALLASCTLASAQTRGPVTMPPRPYIPPAGGHPTFAPPAPYRPGGVMPGQTQNIYHSYDLFGPFAQLHPDYRSYYGALGVRPYESYAVNPLTTYSAQTLPSFEYGYGSNYRLPPILPSILPPDSAARILVIVPDAEAQVWFDGKATTSRGLKRNFETPDLIPGKTYSYTIRAAWTESGQAKTAERVVEVIAGGQVTVDFTRPK